MKPGVQKFANGDAGDPGRDLVPVAEGYHLATPESLPTGRALGRDGRAYWPCTFCGSAPWVANGSSFSLAEGTGSISFSRREAAVRCWIWIARGIARGDETSGILDACSLRLRHRRADDHRRAEPMRIGATASKVVRWSGRLWRNSPGDRRSRCLAFLARTPPRRHRASPAPQRGFRAAHTSSAGHFRAQSGVMKE
jgi:hypothetical protein